MSLNPLIPVSILLISSAVFLSVCPSVSLRYVMNILSDCLSLHLSVGLLIRLSISFSLCIVDWWVGLWWQWRQPRCRGVNVTPRSERRRSPQRVWSELTVFYVRRLCQAKRSGLQWNGVKRSGFNMRLFAECSISGFNVVASSKWEVNGPLLVHDTVLNDKAIANALGFASNDRSPSIINDKEIILVLQISFDQKSAVQNWCDFWEMRMEMHPPYLDVTSQRNTSFFSFFLFKLSIEILDYHIKKKLTICERQAWGVMTSWRTSW